MTTTIDVTTLNIIATLAVIGGVVVFIFLLWLLNIFLMNIEPTVELLFAFWGLRRDEKAKEIDHIREAVRNSKEVA